MEALTTIIRHAWNNFHPQLTASTMRPYAVIYFKDYSLIETSNSFKWSHFSKNPAAESFGIIEEVQLRQQWYFQAINEPESE